MSFRETDTIVKDAAIGQEILDELKQVKVYAEDNVVYGVYDNADKSLWVKIQDFFIDHSAVGVKDKAYFYHMLAVMVDSGIPIVAALRVLVKYTDNRRLKRVLNTVAYECESGSNFADAMSRFGEIFDEEEIGVVRSGEMTGRLNEVLFRLSGELSKRNALGMKLFSAAVYPVAVLIVLVLVTIGMLVWVLPTLLGMFTASGVSMSELPLMTRVLIAAQTVFVGYWWLMAVVLAGLYGLFLAYVSTDYGAVRWDRNKLLLPVVGKLLRKVYALRFVSLLGMLIHAGLPVIKALQITGNSIGNRVYRLKTQEVIEEVRAGKKISDSLADCEFLFSSELVQMFRVGETSANLANVSQKLADQYSTEVDNTLTKISALFEPVMILFVGLFVALMAFAVMAPIFNLSSLIG